MRTSFRPVARLAVLLAVSGFVGASLGALPLARAASTAQAPHYLPSILKTWPSTPAAFPFALQPGSPAYVANIANVLGCNWFGMSGQVFDLQNRGVAGLLVHIQGGGLSFDAPTGSSPKYGSSGWEVTLGTAPITTTHTYSIQLRDGGGQPLSETLFVPTFQDCNKNQVIVNFVQNH